MEAIVPDVSQTCDRSKSRILRKYLNSTAYEKFPSLLTLQSCPIHPENDIFGSQETSKLQVGRMEWKCLLCQKHFKSEYYMDKHLHLKHSDKLLIAKNSVCLADYCSVFGCDDKSLLPPTSLSKFGKVKNSKRSKLFHICNQDDIDEAKLKCESLLNQ